MTEQVQKIICETVGNGGTDRAAALRAGIDPRTLRRWKQQGGDGEEPYAAFLAAYEKAEGDFALRHLLLIGKAGTDGTWQASAWLLERRYPEEYGRKVVQGQFEHSGPGGGPLEVATTTVPLGLTEEEAEAYVKLCDSAAARRAGDAAGLGRGAD